MKQQAFYKKLSGLLKGIIALLVSLILFSCGEVTLFEKPSWASPAKPLITHGITSLLIL